MKKTTKKKVAKKKATTKAVTKKQSNNMSKMVTKKVELVDDLIVFKCTKMKRKKECNNIHFRHAGYVESLMPYARPDKSSHIQRCSEQVLVCTKCKACYIYVSNEFQDITDLIDLKAWDKTEKEMQKATGPGGEC